ncbi:unnamed protein product [Microthlaspi erraticum]|uniref:Uncharacterized protein n=1 Tax=Microthlaspi erraticum TaxID=1685480 RepID=A0A6D2IBE7_9BRAS|nr:unnamed protein product [Microthlaspi erraticum]
MDSSKELVALQKSYSRERKLWSLEMKMRAVIRGESMKMLGLLLKPDGALLLLRRGWLTDPELTCLQLVLRLYGWGNLRLLKSSVENSAQLPMKHKTWEEIQRQEAGQETVEKSSAKFETKKTAMGTALDTDNMDLDEIVGHLQAYEMEIAPIWKSSKGIAFVAETATTFKSSRTKWG